MVFEWAQPWSIEMPLLLIRLEQLDKNVYSDLNMLMDRLDLQLGNDLLNLDMELCEGKMRLWKGLYQLQLNFELKPYFNMKQ